ncbi:hypothetical protein BMS3Bbin02_01812 [bacterium BMS3Bbin02]|nr:hypothetical protein BMS3Bbin02_01812 [bacterium BMS3Bbin02]
MKPGVPTYKSTIQPETPPKDEEENPLKTRRNPEEALAETSALSGYSR